MSAWHVLFAVKTVSSYIRQTVSVLRVCQTIIILELLCLELETRSRHAFAERRVKWT